MGFFDFKLKGLDDIDLYDKAKKRKMFKGVTLETSENIARLIESGNIRMEDLDGKNLNDVAISFGSLLKTKEFRDKYNDDVECTGMIDYCNKYVENNPINEIVHPVIEEEPKPIQQAPQPEPAPVQNPTPVETITHIQESQPKYQSPFTINDYVFEKDGTVRLRNSSVEDVMKESVPATGLANIIMNNPVIKEVIPDMKPEDIFVKGHMLLMKVKRGDTEEIYRIDILGTDILVMAPTEATFQDLNSGEEYNFISVNVCTDLGKKILATADYKVKATDDWDDSKSIFRINQNAA